MGSFDLIHGDALAVLRGLAEASIDAVVSDPPSGISFMGKTWDSNHGGRRQWIARMAEIFAEVLRVTKPGGHALIWALPRTSHWTATALEDAGWDIRDVITHIQGSGFPKSLAISKAIDRLAGAERAVVGVDVSKLRPNRKNHLLAGQPGGGGTFGPDNGATRTAPATEAAKRWDGWGSALKPAVEHWILCRRPLSEPTIAANVLTHGTGALNVAATRVESGADYHALSVTQGGKTRYTPDGANHDRWTTFQPAAGRFPPNLLLSHRPECNGACVPGCPVGAIGEPARFFPVFSPEERSGCHASSPVMPFAYVPKASRRERNAGLPEVPMLKLRDDLTAEQREWVLSELARAGVPL